MSDQKVKTTSGVTATIITKNGAIPGDKLSIPLKKDSKQTEVENKNNELLLQPPYSTEALATLYDMNAYHKRCCLVKAGVTVRLGFSLYNPDDVNAKQEGEEYETAKKFVENNLEEFHNFQLDDEIFGNSYLEVVRNNAKKVSEVYHITANGTYLMLANKVRYLRETIQGATIDYIPYMGEDYKPDESKRHEYIHRKNYNPKNRFYGSPEYAGAINAIYLDDRAKTYNTNRFSDPVPETLIAIANQDKAVEDTIVSFFKNNFADSDKAGRKSLLLQLDESVADLKDKLHIEKLERDTKDSAYRGMRSDNREEIIAAHGLSPRLVGLESAGKLSGGGEVREQLSLINELIFVPRKRSLERIINMLLVGAGVEKWKIRFNNFEYANATEDATFYSTMVSAGIITPDYAAQEMGYPAPSQQGGGISKSDKFTMLLKALKGLRTELEDMRNE